MRKQMIAVAALLGMALMGSGRAHAQSGGTAANLTPADHSEIQHILTSLNQGADFNDSDLWVSQWDSRRLLDPSRWRVVRRARSAPGVPALDTRPGRGREQQAALDERRRAHANG